jgi:hypothetical protein
MGRRLHPTFIISQPDRRLTLLVEVKGGKQVDLAQLERMLKVTPQVVRDNAYVAVAELSSYRVQVAYFCNDEHRTELQEQVANPAVSVIGFDGAGFRTSGASIVDPDLATCLAKSEVASNAAKLAIIPFDRESPDDEVARAIIPHVVNAWVAGAGTVTPDLLVSQTQPQSRLSRDHLPLTCSTASKGKWVPSWIRLAWCGFLLKFEVRGGP